MPDSSQVLVCLQNVVIKPDKCEFNFSQQQDASEIISHILEELCVESPHAQDMLKITIKNQVSCNYCFKDLSNEESTSILHLPVTKFLHTSIKIFLETEELTEPDMFFCNFHES